jgi:hypothetical protein
MRYDHAFEIYQKFSDTGQPISHRFLFDLQRSGNEHPSLSNLIECISIQLAYQRCTSYLHKILKNETWYQTRQLLDFSSVISIPQAVLFVTCFLNARDFGGIALVRERLEKLGVNHDFEKIGEMAWEEPSGDLVSWMPPEYVKGWVGRKKPDFLAFDANRSEM